jgi:DNA-binding winged helix-turn-helix (wHTH) protein
MQNLEPPASLAFHPAAGVVSFGPFQFDRAERLLRRDGAEVALPPRAVGVLEHLLERAGRVVSKQSLIDAVWQDAYVTETSLAEAVSLLRQALGDDPQNPRYIQTLHRRGYRFVAPVTPEAVPSGPAAAQAPSRELLPSRRVLLVALALILAVAAALAMWRLSRPVPVPGPSPIRRLLIVIPPEETLDLAFSPAIAISPGGDRLIYVARRDGTQRLFLRAMDRFEAAPIQATEGAAGPFFSPDRQWVGFFAKGKLRKAQLDGGVGGEALALCDSPYPYGASWSEDGSILFSPNYNSGLLQVSAAGGTPRTLTTPDAAAGELGHRWPDVLPGGRTALFTVWRHDLGDAAIESLDLATGKRKLLIRGGSFPRYSPTGHVVFARAQGLAAVPFDLGRLSVLGPPVAVLSGVRIDGQGGGQVALSANGSLVYVPGGLETRPSAKKDERQVHVVLGWSGELAGLVPASARP